jgi:hypothetical protein
LSFFGARIPNHFGIDASRERFHRQFVVNVSWYQDPHLESTTGIILIVVPHQSLLRERVTAQDEHECHDRK